MDALLVVLLENRVEVRSNRRIASGSSLASSVPATAAEPAAQVPSSFRRPKYVAVFSCACMLPASVTAACTHVRFEHMDLGI